MTDELTPDPGAWQRAQDMEQMEAAFRQLAETVVTLRRTLVEGGFPEEDANVMARRAWSQFFPGQNPLGLLLGGPPQ